MAPFTGFPSGNSPYVPIPEAFFTEIVPHIGDCAELKVTLHLFWLLAHKQGKLRCTNDQELRDDPILLQSLRTTGSTASPRQLLLHGLDLAIAHGTILKTELKLVSEGGEDAETLGWYFFNTARSRDAIARLAGAQMTSASRLAKEAPAVRLAQETRAAASTSRGGRPAFRSPSEPVKSAGATAAQGANDEEANVFALYERHIGLLTPQVADDLKDAAEHYPPGWIEEAISLAMQYQKRRWSYIRGILRRMESERRHS